jgi:hypothetical protein
MSVAALQETADACVVQAHDAAILSRIHEPQTHIAVWQRPLPDPLTAWLNTLPVDALPQERFVASVNMCEKILREIWQDYGHNSSMAWHIAWDMAHLCRLFAALMGIHDIHVRLEAVTGNACKKFHIDFVQARLISTYRGPGSEWGYATHDQMPTVIHQIQTGDVALFKGRLFPGFVSPKALHRSPPIAETGMTRLVLCLDIAEERFDSSHHDFEKLF